MSARSVRRTRRPSVTQQPARAVAAIQVFVSKLDQFLGVELFSADQPVIVGRHRGAQLRLPADNVSREHLRLSLEGGVVVVEDLGSANGTLLNRKKLSGKTDIRPSDTLQLGPYALRLRALLPVTDRADSDVSEVDTKVDAVLAASGSKGTEESAVELASQIDWRIYDEAIRRATGAEPARNVIHLTARATPELRPTAPVRHDTETRVKEPMDEELAERHATARQAPAFLALLRSVTAAQPLPEPETAPELEAPIARSAVARLAELERLMSRLESHEPSREDTRPERPALLDEDDLDAGLSELPDLADAPNPFAVVPGQSMLRERDAIEQTLAQPQHFTPPVLQLLEDEAATETEVEAPGAPATARRYDSLPMSPEIVARSLLAPAHAAPPPRVAARLVTPSIQTPSLEALAPVPLGTPRRTSAGSSTSRGFVADPAERRAASLGEVPVIGGLPVSEVSPPAASHRPPPLPAPRRVSSLVMRAPAPQVRVAQELARDVELARSQSRATSVAGTGPARGASLPASRMLPPSAAAEPPTAEVEARLEAPLVHARGVPSVVSPRPATRAGVAPPQGLAIISRSGVEVPVPSRTTPSQGVAPPARAAVEAARAALEVPLAHGRGPRATPPPQGTGVASKPAVATPSRGVGVVSRSAPIGERASAEIRVSAAPPHGAAAPARNALDASARGTPSSGVPAASRPAPALTARGVVALRASEPAHARHGDAAPARAPAPVAPSRAMSGGASITVGEGSLIPVAGGAPPPLPSARPSIPVQIPTGPRVTLTPPEALGGSGRVKVSGLSSPPPLPRATPTAPVETETAAPAHPAFDGVEITARAGERTLDITTLRKDGDQYVLGHPTPIGAIAPPSAHPGLRLLRIDADRNVDLVFPREVAGQLIRAGETITLNELTEGRKYSCLRLRGGDVVTVMLGIGPKQVSYHIRFVRAPRSISVARGKSGVSAGAR